MLQRALEKVYEVHCKSTVDEPVKSNILVDGGNCTSNKPVKRSVPNKLHIQQTVKSRISLRLH
jgi:hypothetical protein